MKSINFNKDPIDSKNLGLLNSKNNLIPFTNDVVVVDKYWIKNIIIQVINNT